MAAVDQMLAGRDALLTEIGNASLAGHLGLFVGAGFARSVTADGPQIAPGSEELLRLVAADLDIDFDFDDADRVRGRSWAQLASDLAVRLQKRGVPRARAILELKEAVASRCAYRPSPSLARPHAEALEAIGPTWIITTNYDSLLEDLLESSEMLLPQQPFAPRRGNTPVYHIHGHRLDPHSLVFTEEDYVHLFRPAEYRQLKLPILLAESTTLMLGYALGDMNVLTALDWAHRFAGAERLAPERRQGRVVQVLRRPAPTPDPYLGPGGEVVVETSDILDLLGEVKAQVATLEAEFAEARRRLDPLLAGGEDAVTRFLEDGATRRAFLATVSNFPQFYENDRLIRFLGKAMERAWLEEGRRGDAVFSLLVALLSGWGVDRMHPSVVLLMLAWLERVVILAESRGRRPFALPADLRAALRAAAARHGREGVVDGLAAR